MSLPGEPLGVFGGKKNSDGWSHDPAPQFPESRFTWLAPVSQPDLARSQPDLALSQPPTARSQPPTARLQPDPALSPPDLARVRSHPARLPIDPALPPNDPPPQQNDPVLRPNRIAEPFPEATPEFPPSAVRFPTPSPPHRETAPGDWKARVEWERKGTAVIGWNGRHQSTAPGPSVSRIFRSILGHPPSR